MYGPPDEIESHPTGGSYQRPAEQGGGTTSTYPFEKWRYRWIEGIGQNVIMEFVDTTRNGEYRMTVDPSAKDASMYVPGSDGASLGTRRFSRVDGEPKDWGPSLEKLKSDLRTLRDQLVTLRASYSPEHPQVKKTQLQIQAMESLIARLSLNVVQPPGPWPLSEPPQIVAGSVPTEDRTRAGETVAYFRAELAKLRAKYGDAHPDVQAMQLKLNQALRASWLTAALGFMANIRESDLFEGAREFRGSTRRGGAVQHLRKDHDGRRRASRVFRGASRELLDVEFREDDGLEAGILCIQVRDERRGGVGRIRGEVGKTRVNHARFGRPKDRPPARVPAPHCSHIALVSCLRNSLREKMGSPLCPRPRRLQEERNIPAGTEQSVLFLGGLLLQKTSGTGSVHSVGTGSGLDLPVTSSVFRSITATQLSPVQAA